MMKVWLSQYSCIRINDVLYAKVAKPDSTALMVNKCKVIATPCIKNKHSMHFK